MSMLEQMSLTREISESKKGLATKSLIIQAALQIASKSGLEGLTIGNLAEAVQMSKSGVFAHFGSREELQVAVVREYYQRFADLVFAPAMLKPKGLPRLQEMIKAWLKMSIGDDTSSCFFISGAAEFDDRSGIVRDELVRSVEDWRAALLRAIQESKSAGHLKKTVSAEVLLFQLYSIVLGVHHDARFLQNSKSLVLANKLINDIFKSHQIIHS
jgi:AcrR family transcriptional regulator